MTRILVLGGTGMLGQMVVRHLSKDASLVVDGTQRRSPEGHFWFDAEQGMHGLLAVFKDRGKYDYIINCIGVIKPGINQTDPYSIRRAIIINALFPYDVSSAARQTGARVIHISTDSVFAGTAESYSEDADHDCTDVYGKTKSLGEVCAPGFLTIRCSIIGPDPISKRGLLAWFLGQPDGSDVKGYTDHLWNGVTTLQFGQLCHKIIVQDRYQTLWEESCFHHFCPNQPISKYELLKLFQAIYKKNVNIVPTSGVGPSVRRILTSQYHGIKQFFSYDVSQEQAIRELAEQG